MMQRSDVLYDNLLRLLTEYTLSGALFEPHFDTLANREKEEQMIGFGEEIETYINEIIVAKNGGLIHNKFQPLIDTLRDFSVEFPTYPTTRLDEILLIIKIISFIDTEVTGSGNVLDLTANVDENLFCLNPLTRPIPEINFVYYDVGDLQNSILVLDMSDLSNLNSFIDSQRISIDLLFALLTKLGEGDDAVSSGINVMIRASQNGLQNSIFACVALHLVKSGKLVHAPFNYSALPKVNTHRRIMSDKKYQQFNDSLIILSEYNGQKDILDKYLRIYHLVENFMFKLPVVRLEGTHHNTPFSIRDFRLLYSKIDKSEISVMKDLMADVMKLDYSPGLKFSSALFVDWGLLNPSLIADLTNINKLFDLLNVNTAKGEPIKYETVKEADLPLVFAKLVYGFRNSLVHNRETEFHLTHETLLNHIEIGETAKIVMESFVLPWLEEISFYLIIEDNDLVWYRNPALTLYSE